MGNELDKNKDQQQDPQQKRDQGQGQGQSQDFGKKNPNTQQETPDQKNREGSEDVEKRRAS
jgi:hypothetical protein